MHHPLRHIARALALALGLVLAQACEKEPPANPFEGGAGGSGSGGSTGALVYAGLPGLQDALFAPTCANSGCHDGTFEPDFRTLGSTHATLVDQALTKRDPDGHYVARVVPGDTARSGLLLRLTRDIDGRSGVMPLALEPDSRYEAQRDTLLGHVRRWIAEGAKLSQ